jgi:transcriptional regulator with XRE-family HTH domain
MDSAQRLGRRVAGMRVLRHLSTQEMAVQTGLQYQTIWRIERGIHKNPGIFTMRALARVLGCTLDWLADIYGDEAS